MCNVEELPKLDFTKKLIWHGNKDYCVEYIGPLYECEGKHVIRIQHPRVDSLYSVVINDQGVIDDGRPYSILHRVTNEDVRRFLHIYKFNNEWCVNRIDGKQAMPDGFWSNASNSFVVEIPERLR